MGAVRTARGFTKRDKVVIVEGSFHGLYDEMMWKSDLERWTLGSRAPPNVIPFGGGIPRSSLSHVDIISFNDDEMLEAVFKKQGDEIACVLLEPIIGNAGSISARPDWLQRLRDLCSSHGSLLLIDEVKSGFRVAQGGAQQLCVAPRALPLVNSALTSFFADKIAQLRHLRGFDHLRQSHGQRLPRRCLRRQG